MKTLDETINELTKLKKKLGGNSTVIFEFNGGTQSGELCEISKIDVLGYFLASEGDPFSKHDIQGGDLLFTCDYEPMPDDTVTNVVRIYSDREKYDCFDTVEQRADKEVARKEFAEMVEQKRKEFQTMPKRGRDEVIELVTTRRRPADG